MKSCGILTGLKKITQKPTWYLQTCHVRHTISDDNPEKNLTVTNIFGRLEKEKHWDISAASGYLKVLVHLLQLRHGVPNVRLQCHAALVRRAFRLPEHINLLFKTPGVPLLHLTPMI